LRGYAAEGQFAGGSMGPKVEAVCRFVEATGRRAAITSLHRIAEAVAGTTGTQISPDPRVPSDVIAPPTPTPTS
jgi:carbamate kinase